MTKKERKELIRFLDVSIKHTENSIQEHKEILAYQRKKLKDLKQQREGLEPK